MKILLHGDNTTQSRLHLVDLISSHQNKKYEIIKLNGKKINLTKLIQATESGSLFNDNKCIIVEELHSNRSKSVIKDASSQINLITSTNISIIVWESKKIYASTIKKFTNFQHRQFKTPASIFKFLDSIKTNNYSNNLSSLQSALKDSSAELIFFMLSRRIADLITLDDNKKLAPWQKSKLKRQKGAFSEHCLKSVHKQLFIIDSNQKTGKSISNMESELEKLMINI